MSILHAKGLQKQYRMGQVIVNAVRGVELVIEKGEFVAIMGPSGSGKSTLLHLLGGLDVPSGGEIVLDGQTLSNLSDEALTILRRRQIGFIFQFFNLLPTLTAAENIALPLLIDGRALPQYTPQVNHLLHLVGLDQRGDHKPDQLSGGQQQRVAIARALITQPALILADEPTGNLDSQSGKEVLAILRRACDEQQQTIVMVTHDPRAAETADRVIQMQDGQILS